MLVRKGDEVNALVPEELREDIQGFVDVGPTEAEGACPVLASSTRRRLGPDDAVSDAVGADARDGPNHLHSAVSDFPQLRRHREVREFEGGVYAL